MIIARYEIMINVKSYSKINKLQDSAFVQLKNPETSELEVTETGEKIGFELHSIQSNEFKRALRSTAHLGLTKKEQENQKELLQWIQDGTKPSDENLDILDEYEDRITKRMQRVFAIVTKKLHNIELLEEDAKALGIKLTAKGKVSESVDNILALYVALPDLSAQIGDAIADKQNFINA